MPDFHSDPHAAPSGKEQLHLLMSAFEAGTLPRERWTHAAHLCVGSVYVVECGFETALLTMRHRVRAYNEAVGTPNTDTRGYHETLTRLWLMVLARLRDAEPTLSQAAFAVLAVEHYGHRRDLHASLYSFDVVKDVRARREWVEPDLPVPMGIIS